MNKIERIHELIKRLNQYRDEYYNQNMESVTNEVYDRLFDELKSLESETGCVMSNSPTQTVGYKTVSSLKKVQHQVPLLSLDKTKLISELLSFINGKDVLFSLKLDGLTVKLEYYDGFLKRASTRGDGYEGEDITHNISVFKNVPLTIPYLGKLIVTGEAFIYRNDFEKLKESITDSSGKPYRNSRNMASGSARCLNSEKCSQRMLNFIPFNVLEGLNETPLIKSRKSAKLDELSFLGFSNCDSFLYESIDLLAPRIEGQIKEVESTIERLKMSAQQQNIPIDGIVVTYDDINYSKSCGRTGHHYKDGIAFKFEDELYETVLRSIEWNTTRFGEIAPVGIFDTIEIDGCDVSRASLHNLTFIKNLQLNIGDRILVSKRNMIIPQIEENLDRETGIMEFPICCPCCGTKTEVSTGSNGTTETLVCPNEACAAKNIRRFIHFVSKKAMNIDGMSEAYLTRFIDKGWIQTYADIYHLNKYHYDIVAMDGFGEKSYERLWKAIEASRSTTFEHFLVAMDIPLIGSAASRTLAAQFDGNIDTFLAAVKSGYDFTNLDDFGDTLKGNIQDWFQNSKNIEILNQMKEEVVFMNTQNNIVSGSSFEGKTVIVTGTLHNFTRDEINSILIGLGAKAGSSVSKKTDYVIAGEKAGSKLTKAHNLGITVLSEDEFLPMIENK